MSNQRSGKSHAAALGDGRDAMALKNFFRTAAQLLWKNGNEDAAFYFEQVQSHLEAGKGLSQDEKDISRILGL